MSIEEIRMKIDGIDNRIHDLLMERADLGFMIGEEKRRNNVQIVHPAREISMIRRLLSRHKGFLQQGALVRIWRELVGAISLLQADISVAVAAPGGNADIIYWGLAKDYFSSILPMQMVPKPLAVLSMVREGQATFGVLPWPVDGVKDSWWQYLMDETGDKKLRIVARLPIGCEMINATQRPDQQALLVGRMKFEPSGDDRSFVALDIAQGVSRGKLVDKARTAGLELRSLQSISTKSQVRSLHLLEFEGYIASDDGALAIFTRSLESDSARAVVIGGYPVPLDFKARTKE